MLLILKKPKSLKASNIILDLDILFLSNIDVYNSISSKIANTFSQESLVLSDYYLDITNPFLGQKEKSLGLNTKPLPLNIKPLPLNTKPLPLNTKPLPLDYSSEGRFKKKEDKSSSPTLKRKKLKRDRSRFIEN